MKTTLTLNHFPQVRREIPRALQGRLLEAAEGLRLSMVDGLNGGDLPIQSDTEAMANSLSVQSKGALGVTSDAAQRTAKARTAYTQNPSVYRDAVRESLDPEAYTAKHFDERLASEEPLPDGATATAAVMTLWMVATLWEVGHFNAFTGNQEHRPWMHPATQRWGLSNFLPYFGNLIKG